MSQDPTGAAYRANSVAYRPDSMLTVKQAADLLQMNLKLVYALVKEKRIPTVQFSPRTTRIRYTDLQKALGLVDIQPPQESSVVPKQEPKPRTADDDPRRAYTVVMRQSEMKRTLGVLAAFCRRSDLVSHPDTPLVRDLMVSLENAREGAERSVSKG